MAPIETKQWVLVNKPKDLPKLSGSDATFELKTSPLPSLGDGQVLLKTLYLSNDPAQRGWISGSIEPERLYVDPVAVGAPMHARGIAQVVESKASNLKDGDYVMAPTNWSEYAVLDAKSCKQLQEIPGISMSHYLGALGHTGLTAYYGLAEIAKLTKDEAVVVSGAAGATGSMAVQIAKKMIGAKRVVGIAGTDEKCRWVEKLGADVCLNYKKPSFREDLIKATDGFVEVYFDNVGGEILDLMLTRIKRHGRIAACGAISNYNREGNPRGLLNYFEVISNRISILGFIVFDYLHKAGEVVQLFTQALKEGKLTVDDSMEMVIETEFEDVPKTWMKLFEGGNTGKLITKLR